jgi:tungstate transport system ATP-binding protein
MSNVLPIQGRRLVLSVQGRTVLDVPDISVGTAACTAIIGPNGAGKSLLLRALGGLLTLDKGVVTWGESPALRPQQRLRSSERERRLAVGFVSQRPALLARSAVQNLVYALRARGVSGSQAREKALVSLESAGLSQIVNTPAQRLSAGEQQRLALARALVLEPAILLLDEPTASVDPVSTAPIEAMLKQASREGCRIVIVSHDLNQVKRIADEVILMNRGSVEEQQAAQPFFKSPQSQAAKQWLAGELLV